MRKQFEYDVFLSYSSQDKARVRILAHKLDVAGLNVWFDEWIFKPGDDIYLKIEQGLDNSQAQILCMSKAAFGSDWVTLERNTSLFRDPTNQERRLVPLLLEDCTIPDTIKRLNHIDVRIQNDKIIEEIVNACLSSDADKRPPYQSKQAIEPEQLVQNPKSRRNFWKRITPYAVLSIFLCTLLLLALYTWKANKSGRLSGRVQDETGKPLPDVVITIPDIGLSTLTDENGRFKLEIPRERMKTNHSLIANLDGYVTKEEIVVFKSNEIIIVLYKEY